MTAAANILPLCVAVPLAGAFLTSFIGRRVKWMPDCLGVATTAVLLILSLASVSVMNAHGTLVYSVGAWKPPVGIALVLDALTVFMLVTVNLVAFAVVLFSINYMERFTSKWKFYTLFLLMLAGMNGVVVTGDIFNLFVFCQGSLKKP